MCRRAILLLLAGWVWAGNLSAWAADIAVLPTGLTLAAPHGRGVISVTNGGDQAVVMEVETLRWTQEDGQDRHAPTHDLLVNPSVFSIPAGRSQLLRVGLRGDEVAGGERAYRLVLKEVPTASPAGAAAGPSGQVTVLLNLRLPIYVAPAKVVHAQVWQAQWTQAGGLAVSVNNTGTTHVVISELALRDTGAAPDAAPLAALKRSDVVFPGQHRNWSLPAVSARPDQSLVLDVVADGVHQTISPDPRPPLR